MCGFLLAVILRQSAGSRQKGQQVMVPALSCCYMPSFTRHLQDIMLSGCSSPPLLLPCLFPFSGPVFIFPIHWTCTPQNTSAPSSSAFLAVLCLTKIHALVFSALLHCPHCAHPKNCGTAEDGKAETVGGIGRAENCIYCSLHNPGKP